jgi:hypothetical protein
MVGGGSLSLALSSGGGEVHRYYPLHLECGLVSRWLMQLGHGGRLFAGEHGSPLRCLVHNVGLQRVGSRTLPLPKSAPSLEGRSVFGRDASARGGIVVMA